MIVCLAAKFVVLVSRHRPLLFLVPLLLQVLLSPCSSRDSSTTIFCLPLVSAYAPPSVVLSSWLLPSSSIVPRHHHHQTSYNGNTISRRIIGGTDSSLSTKTQSTPPAATPRLIPRPRTSALGSTRALEIWIDMTTSTDSSTSEEKEDVNHRLSLYRTRSEASAAVIVGPNSTAHPTNPSNPPFFQRGTDDRLRTLSATGTDTIVGVVVDPSTPDGIDTGTAAMGSTEWIAALPPTAPEPATPTGWNMIPAENLVGAARGTGTKIAFSLLRPGDAAGLEGALEQGVDALCVPLDADDAVWDAAVHATAERRDRTPSDDGRTDGGEDRPDRYVPRITTGTAWRKDRPAVRADRVCLDLVRTLSPTEGCWVGSSAKLLALVLSEAAVSELVPSRPFRVNAGPVHSYVLMGDGTTVKYLSEVTAGEEVCVCDAETGGVRGVAVGRVKVEVRPCVMVGLAVRVGSVKGGWSLQEQEGADGDVDAFVGGGGDDDDVEELTGQIFLQQAETVRLGQHEGGAVCVTDLRMLDATSNKDISRSNAKGHSILLRIVGTGTHIGKAYGGKVLER